MNDDRSFKKIEELEQRIIILEKNLAVIIKHLDRLIFPATKALSADIKKPNFIPQIEP